MRYRLVEVADLPACLALLDRDGRCRLSPRVRERLAELWRDYLLADRRRPKPFVLWEDVGMRPQPRLEAIGTGLFVHDEVYDELVASGRPYLADQLYTMVLDGRRPLLDGREIARANAGAGLSVVMPHYIQREHDLDHPDSRRLMPLGPAAWFHCYAGYNVRRIAGELYGHPAGRYMSAGGFEVRAVFDAVPGSPDDSEPHLCEMDRARVTPGALNAMALWVMLPPQPCLGLRPSQQAVALHAMQGHTDRAIAALLGISADAVKQAWRGILAAAAGALPELTAAPHHDGLAPVRGAEHRRVVVEYLRQHMEELRPWPRAGSRPAA